MSELYTRFMEKVMPVLQEYWQLTIIGAGLLFLLGAIFNWKWTWDPNGHKPMGFNAWIYRNFGEKGARINTGFIGTIIVICGFLMWVLIK